jgi:hypothetical protein
MKLAFIIVGHEMLSGGCQRQDYWNPLVDFASEVVAFI